MTTQRTTRLKYRYLAWAALLLAPAALGAKGCDIAVVGSECGGLTGEPCGTGEFCDFAPDAACGAADRTGTCEAVPEACTFQFDPVCGCDGQTYPNACAANAEGVSVASEGECAPTTGSACGGLLGLDCSDGDFCNFAPDAFCGAADQTGTCTETPDLCADVFLPVCGCDDVTYPNACEANGAGVSVASEGACGGPLGEGAPCGGLLGLSCSDGELCDFAPGAFCGAADQTGTCRGVPEACDLSLVPVCGCDGVTYGNACVANTAGVSVASEGACQSGGGNDCGGLLGLACAAGEFCNFAPDAFCGAADQTGTCEPTPRGCTREFNPVCGCDGVTYSNDCVANAAGVSVASEGECLPSGNACGGLQGLQCADGEFCDFALDAICGAADQTGTCRATPQACDAVLDPVCGCDDQTYGNACEANAAGISVAAPGECP